jgi:NADH dehydrogenase [ubiquinone] 1 alpha subcomplex assembly factor 7
MKSAETSLLELIRNEIALEGPMNVERFMRLALSDPRHGYYMTHDPLGAAADFITAPEISQMFGELVGLWSAGVWTAMGRPPQLRLIELGPGRGTLMQDALRAARIMPEFREAIDVHLVETSPVLRDAQRTALAVSGISATWHEQIEEVPDGPAIILANEFFDALPVRHYVKTASGWCERLIGLDSNQQLVFGASPQPEPSIKTNASEGAILEIGTAAYRTMLTVASRLIKQGGAALVIDYGHTQTGTGETLQAVKKHQFVDPLAAPGEADLTAHVDFAALGRAARAVGAEVHGPVPQGEFLLSLGITERAAALKRRAGAGGAAEIDSALWRLVGTEDSQMGNLFKVLCVCQRGLAIPPGFGQANNRHG